MLTGIEVVVSIQAFMMGLRFLAQTLFFSSQFALFIKYKRIKFTLTHLCNKVVYRYTLTHAIYYSFRR